MLSCYTSQENHISDYCPVFYFETDRSLPPAAHLDRPVPCKRQLVSSNHRSPPPIQHLPCSAFHEIDFQFSGKLFKIQ